MIMAPISLPTSCQQQQQPKDTEVDIGLASDNYPSSTILARKRASVHIIEGSTSAKRISLLFKNSRCRSFSESWAFLSSASGVSPIDEREGRGGGSINNNGRNGSGNITDNNNAPSPSSLALRLSPLRPTEDIDCDDSASSSPVSSTCSTPSHPRTSSTSSSTSTTATASTTLLTPASEETETTALSSSSSSSSSSSTTTTTTTSSSSSLSELPPSSLNLFRQPAVTGATAYEDLPDQELLKTLAAFLRGDSSDKKGSSNRPSATTSRLNQDKDESEMCDLVVTVRDFAYPKSHPYHVGNYPPEPEYEESDIEEDDEECYTEEAMTDDSSVADTETIVEDDRTEGYARGLYDFDAENSSELSFKEGEFVWIHCRQFPGWFLGEKDGAQGLVPENYVQLV